MLKSRLEPVQDAGFWPRALRVRTLAGRHGRRAFRAIWQAFPDSTLYGLAGTLISLPLLNPLARLCYKGFARIRRYLPKRHRDCESGTCRIGKDR